VDHDRLRRYRLSPPKEALKTSDCGALLLFDVNNIRYVSGTKIGEWERDKMCRFCLLAGDEEPYVWDFGSAAVHHREYCDWLDPERCRAGVVGMRGTIPPSFGLMKNFANEIAGSAEKAGVADMPVGVDYAETAMFFALQEAGIKVVDGQQIMLGAREIKNCRRDPAAEPGGQHGRRRLSHDLEELKPGIRENDIVAMANKMLYEMGSRRRRGDQRHLGRALQPASAQLHRPLLPPGDQAFFDILQSYQGYRTCYYRTFNIGRATPAQVDAYVKAREWLDAAIALIKPGVTTDKVAKVWPTAESLGFPNETGGLRAAVRARPGACAARAADHQPGGQPRPPDGDPDRHGLRARDLLPGDRRLFGRADRGRGRRHRQGLRGDQPVPGRGTADRQPLLTPCRVLRRERSGTNITGAREPLREGGYHGWQGRCQETRRAERRGLSADVPPDGAHPHLRGSGEPACTCRPRCPA
jgi:Xaa-Pro aminopeptidase